MDKAFQDLDDWFTSSDMPNGKKQVLKAALKLFSTQGYDGTSTAQIAKMSGMSQATIFKYFKSKDELLLYIIKPMIEHLLPVYGQEFAQEVQGQTTTLEDAVHFIVQNRYQFLVQNRDVAIILISQLIINDDIKGMVLDKIASLKEIFVDNIWKNLQASGELREDIDLITFVRLVASQIVFYFMQSQRIMQITDEQQIQNDLHKIEALIIRAIKK